MGVNCESCRRWTPIGAGLGECELTETLLDKPLFPESRAIAITLRCAPSGAAALHTHRSFCCNQFSRRGERPAGGPANKEARGAIRQEAKAGKPGP